MRILKWLVGGVGGLAVVLGGVFVWGMQRVSAAREARVQVPGPLVARATAMETPRPEDACLVVEGHDLKRETVLTAECKRVTLEATRPGVMRFHGLVMPVTGTTRSRVGARCRRCACPRGRGAGRSRGLRTIA
ncbi:hypothetical protein [Myxococcus fulvus]|uniref:hypothetical protein n=1 Tax=Myxococcus fulvus TaxID=33 RepID=UPI0020BF3156|nr:hypothetical protein [Myxococcus fulvus]MCK8502410.1 hypothetical protein [Myxococcus fulvus]